MKTLLIILLFLHNPFEWNADRKLQWSDFEGKYEGQSVSASVCTGITLTEAKDSAGGIIFTVAAVCDPAKSYVAPECSKSAYALRHEQVHFDIAEVYARTMREKLESLQHTHNQADVEVAGEIYKFGLLAWGDMDILYDQETKHGQDTDAQWSWNHRVATELKKTESVCHHPI